MSFETFTSDYGAVDITDEVFDGNLGNGIRRTLNGIVVHTGANERAGPQHANTVRQPVPSPQPACESYATTPIPPGHLRSRTGTTEDIEAQTLTPTRAARLAEIQVEWL